MDILAKPSPPTDTQLINQQILNAGHVKRRKEKQSPLENALNTERLAWLGRYATRRRDSYYSALSGWRTKLERYEFQSQDNFDWRKREGNRNKGHKSIFDVQNDSLNVIGAFAEFFTAQAKNDLFGSSPWFAARPEGKADAKLADDLTKHAAWKLSHSNLVEVYNEGVKLATDLGTCFTKKSWMVEVDEYEEPVTLLIDAETKQPIYTSAGEGIYADDKIIEDTGNPDGTGATAPARRYPEKDPTVDLTNGKYAYQTGYRKASNVVYKNVKAFNLHYKDVAFDPLAPALELVHTDFFHSFTKGLLDIGNDYGVSREDLFRIHASLKEKAEAAKPNASLNEAQAEEADDEADGMLKNMPVRLMEGYMRCDVLRSGKPVNIYVVFCPEIELVIKVDYLANITPGGLLPVHAHTIERLPYRIVGRGFYEHLEKAQTIIDDAFNRINWHDRKRSNPITGLDKSQLMQEDEEEDEPFNDEKPVNLKPDAKLEDYIQFKDYPDLSNRTTEMLHLVTQMVQLRKGITAASQGDLTGAPETNTATGIKQLMSRASVLLKAPIDDLKRSFTKDLYYTVKLIYSNFDRDEAFVYGEGENMELIEIQAAQVRNLEVDINLLLTQAQNQYKLENAQLGIQLFSTYSQLPELEKQYGRMLFIQALRALDFADADQIIRQAAVDMESAMAILPPEVQQQIAAVMQTAQVAQAAPIPAGNAA